MKLSKIIILFSLFMLGDLLSAMEFRVIDFYEDTYNRYNNSYSKQQLIERSESLFIIKINFSEPFHIQAIDDIKKMNRFPDTYIGQVKTNADSLVITKKNYEECIFRFPSNIEKGKQYVVEIESIEAYYLNIDFHPSNGATYLNGNKYIYGQSTLPGKYHLTHFHDGYKPKEDSIEVNQKTHYFSYDLVPEEKKQIRITTYPDSATVFQNNKEIGITPLTINFDSHKNKFEIRKKMFRPIIESISDNENIEKEYRLEPVNFKISITPPDARIILIDEFDKTVNFFQYKQTHFADLKAGKYKLIISKNGFRKYKDEILLNSENKYDNQINLKESFWSKIHKKKNSKSEKIRLTALGYQTFINSKSNYDIHGIGFDWAILPSNKTGFFEPKLSISTLSIMQDENPHQLLAFPTYLGFALNFLGESKINVKPSLGFVFIPYQYDGNINKSYGYSYGVSLLYWFKQNLGLGISYEKGENQINNEELIEQNLKSTEKIMIKMKYRLKDFDDFSDYEFGLDQLSAFRGENLNSNRFYLQGITYKPLSLMNKMKKNFLLPYVSFDKIKFLNKYSTANFDMLSANLGMQLIFGSDDTQFKFYSTFGWSPNWKSNNNNNILQTKSYSAKLGFSLNYQKYLLSRFLNLGIEYIKYFDVEELENNSNSYLDGFLLAKIGVNFHKIRPELSKISNRLINDFDFFIKLDKIYVDGFESKLGGGIAKYFDKHKSVIQEVSVSYSDFRKDKNKLSIYNLSYGIGASFFRDYSFDAIPIVKINWAPFMYDFDESYVLNDVDSKRKTVWDNFTWSYGVSFKTSFTKFGLTYGYERSKSLRGKYKINQSNKEYELISDSVKLGVFYIF